MKFFLKLGNSFLLLILLVTTLSACGKSYEEILTSKKWKGYARGYEMTYEFNKDGTGQSQRGKYNPNEFKWKINDNRIIIDDNLTFIISKDEGVYKLKREERGYSGEYVLVREKDFKKLYDFEDHLISQAEWDVYLIYNANFSENYVEINITDVESFNDIYTVSGTAKYTENNKSYRGKFEIHYKYDDEREEFKEIDNYFDRPN